MQVVTFYLKIVYATQQKAARLDCKGTGNDKTPPFRRLRHPA